MKIWTSTHVFSHPWETIASAAWRKYPNPMNPSVTGVDVIDRHVDQDGKLQSHRLMTTSFGLPTWVTDMLGDQVAHVSEHSEVDPQTKTLTLRAKNLTFQSYLTIEEKIIYSPHPDDKSKTLLQQQASILVQGVPLTSYLENMVVSNINNNASNGRQAIEWVIGMIKTEAQDLSSAMSRGVDSAMSDFTKNVDSLMHKSKPSGI
ncbi:PRELI domain containing protein 3B-like [Lineus longissimus]|uniref:PRELI domain containing protein 3B-like n=1 Tax=Lineus longissimus TaxID=88925 RepID=UPI002B4D4AE2